ncbi:site-specific integrase [Kineococcus aurantiacus]|nr:site-specific integrase [Kineococcus aurantiacus]
MSAWNRWARWASAHNLPILPARPSDVARWIVDDGASAAVSTITTWTSAIGFVHRQAGHTSPLADAELRDTLAGLRRNRRRAPAQAPPLWTSDVERILAAIDDSPAGGESLADVRDRALVLLAFASALRASELAALQVGDLEPDTDGLIVRVRTSKTDQVGQGAFVGIPWAQRPQVCPVRAVDAWLTRLYAVLAAASPAVALEVGPQDPLDDGEQFGTSERSSAQRDPGPRLSLARRRKLLAGIDGALFRSVRGNRLGTTTDADPTRARLHRNRVGDIITRRAQAAGLQTPGGGRYYSAHSTRAGFATQAAANGASERAIMEQGRWKSLAVARGYIRRGGVFDDNAASRLGL